MSRAQKIYLLILSLYVIFDFVLGSLVSLFLWEQTKNIQTILSYHFFLFLSIIVFTQFGSHRLQSSTPNSIYSLSIVLGVIQAFLLYLFQHNLSSMIPIIGFTSGGVIGLQAVSSGRITQSIQSGDSLRFISLKSATTNLVALLTIPILTYLITHYGTYSFSYILGLVIGVVLILSVRLLPLTRESSSYRPILAMRNLWSLPEMRNYIFSRFIYGFFNGPIWAVLGIITFRFVGNLAVWGIISTLLSLTQILGSYFFGKLQSRQYQISYAVIATLLFGSVTLFLGINWNFITFMGYQIGLTLLGITFSLQFENTTFELLNLDALTSSYQKEIVGLGEICLGLGRLAIIGLLIVINFNFDNELYVRLLLLGIASIPLLISSRQKSAILYT